nr:LysM peptidoglycan-binding domain-containing protein [uncultured Tyzzerella sp.]
MSSKDNENKNSQQLFSEDITKRLVKKILDDDNDNMQQDNTKNTNKSDFNIEYEEYDNQQFDEHYENYDEDAYYEEYEEDFYDDQDYEDYKPKRTKRAQPVKEQSKRKQRAQDRETNYRKNIEKYGKEFFDDDYDDYEDNSPSLLGRVISFSVIVVLTISTAFLAFSLISTKKDLTEAKAQIQELLDSKEETENKIAADTLKQENETLKQENEDLKAQLNPNQNNSASQSQQTTKPSNNSNSGNNSNNSSASEYIVQEGDVIWNISKKVYGNGSHFQKILDANGLKENSVLKPGQKLIIPKLN